MRSFFKSSRFKGFLGVFGVLLLAVIFAAATNDSASPASDVLGTVFMPLQSLSARVANRLEDFNLHFRSAASYAERVKALEKEVAGYQEQLVDYEKSKQQLALYEEFLELKKERGDFKFESAAIVGHDAADVYSTFTLNKGTLDGVAVNNPVIYGKYLVGVVVKAAPTYCVVNTILNPAVNAGAYEVRTRETGYSTTTAELAAEGKCRLSGLERTTAAAPGGVVCTSGTGGVYPPDLIIGVVEEVKNDTTNISSYAVVSIPIDFSDLRDVFVITSFRGMGVSTRLGGGS